MNNIEIGILKTKFDIFKINRVLLLCFRAYTVRQFKHECHVTAYFAALFYNINLRKTREFAGRIFKNTYMEAENSQKLSNSPKLSLSLSRSIFTSSKRRGLAERPGAVDFGSDTTLYNSFSRTGAPNWIFCSYLLVFFVCSVLRRTLVIDWLSTCQSKRC